MIQSNGYKTTLTVPTVQDEDADTVRYAVQAYGYVNGTRYSVSLRQWISNIKQTYDANEPRSAEIIRVLTKYL